MTKHTIEIFRDKKAMGGYGWLNLPYTEYEVLDAIAKLCNLEDKKVYKHLIRHEEENVSKSEFYSPASIPKLKIPYCEKVVYCDVWLQ